MAEGTEKQNVTLLEEIIADPVCKEVTMVRIGSGTYVPAHRQRMFIRFKGSDGHGIDDWWHLVTVREDGKLDWQVINPAQVATIRWAKVKKDK